MDLLSTAAAERRRRFESIADEVYEPLQRYLHRRAAREDADELLDDVLLTVWRRLGDVPTDAVLPWCYGVARRALANQRRSKDRYRRLVARLAAQPRLIVDADGADDHPVLAAALARLSESDREIIRLWAWEQLEPRDIATVINSTPNAVSLRISRAKKKLANEMTRQDSASAGHIRITDTQEHGS